jgi:D-3-phosphoglycerate dehydrogenase
MKFLIFEHREIHKKAIHLLEKNGFETQINIPNQNQKKEIEAFFIRSYTKITKNLIKEYPNLKFILRAGVGLDNIDIDACQKKDIKIFNSPGANANAVSELVICLMILLLRKIPQQINSLKNGNWRDRNLIGAELKNKTIGLLGCGAIGQLIAQKLYNFNVKEIIAYDPFLDIKTLEKHNVRKYELDEVLKNSDIISLHLPLNSQTRGMINNQKLNQIKKGTYLINTSRGGILDESALIYSLKKGHLAGAALDVFENEPNINLELHNLPNLIPTPHIGAFSQEADESMSIQTVKNFLRFFNNSKN